MAKLSDKEKEAKQRQLMEDADVIHRIQRAPERRVFYIDTGSLPSEKAIAFVKRIAKEIKDKSKDKHD